MKSNLSKFAYFISGDKKNVKFYFLCWHR